MALYMRLMAELDAGGKHNSEQISEIDLTDPEDARVLMPEQGGDILAHFGEDHFLERYQRYKAHIAEWRQQYPQLASVDLRYENQVVLDMASGKQAADGRRSGANERGGARSGSADEKPRPARRRRPGQKERRGAKATDGSRQRPAAKKSKPSHDEEARDVRRSGTATKRGDEAETGGEFPHDDGA